MCPPSQLTSAFSSNTTFLVLAQRFCLKSFHVYGRGCTTINNEDRK